MARPLRILHLADSHLGSQLPARPRRRDEWRRGDDIVRSYRRVLDRAREFDVDLVLHAGDVFDEPNPSDAAITAAATPLLALAADGIAVVIVPGNHERSILPGSLFLSHPNIHIFGVAQTKSLTLRGRRLAIAGIPCIRRHSAVRFAAALEETQWPAAKADLNILLTHQAFDSSTCGPANYRFRKDHADVVDRALLPREFHYVAAGHIHRQQVLRTRDEQELAFDDRDVPIVYSGSVDRITFAEQEEPKGCMLLEETDRGLAHRFIQHEVRAMAWLPLDVSGLSRSAIRAAAAKWAQRLPQGTLAQVRLSGRTTPAEMRGLRLSAEMLDARPDLLMSVSSQAVVFEPQRANANSAAIGREHVRELEIPPTQAKNVPSPFDSFEEADSLRVACEPANLKSLPTGFATYAFHDADGRLLYIGKASNLRSRVRQHLSARPSGAFFEGWVRDIARIEARLAHSELEASLAEAELIRIHRPPFNRQMRAWERYCYLVEGTQPHGQLSIVRDVSSECADGSQSSLQIYGPYRSRWEAAAIAEAVARHASVAYCENLALPARLRRVRDKPIRSRKLPIALNLCQRYFDQICSGPCAARVSSESYERQLTIRRAILRGEDDSSFSAVESQLEALAEEPRELNEKEKSAIRFVHALRQAFEAGRIAADARILLGTTLALPAPADHSLCVTIGPDTLRFCRKHPGISGLAANRVSRPPPEPMTAIPKSRFDLLATLVRHQRREVCQLSSENEDGA